MGRKKRIPEADLGVPLACKVHPDLKSEFESYAHGHDRTPSAQLHRWVRIIMASPDLRQQLELWREGQNTSPPITHPKTEAPSHPKGKAAGAGK